MSYCSQTSHYLELYLSATRGLSPYLIRGNSVRSGSPVFDTGSHTLNCASSVLHFRGPRADRHTTFSLIPSRDARTSGCYRTSVKHPCKRLRQALIHLDLRLCAATRATGQTPIEKLSPDPRITSLSLYISLSLEMYVARQVPGRESQYPDPNGHFTFPTHPHGYRCFTVGTLPVTRYSSDIQNWSKSSEGPPKLSLT